MSFIFLGSLFLSLLHSILFFKQRLGISVLLFTVPTIIFLILVLKKHKYIKNKMGYILLIPIIGLSATYFLFNNFLFNIVNIFVILILLAIMLIWLITDKILLSSILQKTVNVILGPIEFLGESVKTVRQTIFPGDWEEHKQKSQKAIKITKAFVIAIPIILVILYLLISADSVFANLFSGISEQIQQIFTVEEMTNFILRIVIIVGLFLYFISFLYNLMGEDSSFSLLDETTRPKKICLEGLTVNMVLTGLNLLYLLFCGIQVLYLFTKVEVGADFNYAQYARQGFFQLMFVSVINLVLILISTANTKEVSKSSKNYTKLMNLIMACFTFVLIFSSFIRMNMYEQEYGYTLLRILVYFALATESILMIPTILYVLGAKLDLLKTYLVLTCISYMVLNFMNIDTIIAKRNVDRYFETLEQDGIGKIDMSYLQGQMSTDGTDEMLRLLDSPDKELRRQVNNYFYYQTEFEPLNWKEYNISKAHAQKEIEKRHFYYQGFAQ